MKEIWKDIKGYEGIYQVSTYGRIRNLCYYNGEKYIARERILKRVAKNNKYIQVILCKEGRHENRYVHRLVAEAFIPNPNCLQYVNHKNFNKADNRIENLEWCTQSYNVNYSYTRNRMPLPPPQKPKKVKRNDGKIYNSLEEAGNDLNINPSIICNQLKGRQKTAKGYSYTYV